MRIRLLMAATAALLAATTFPSAANADHSWAGYHWARTANPFTLKLDDNVSSAWDSYFTSAAADWTPSTNCARWRGSSCRNSPTSPACTCWRHPWRPA